MCLLPLTPVMTAEDPLETNNREKSSTQKDFMMRGCVCAPMPSTVKSKVAESVGLCRMCIRDRPQRRVASKLVCRGLAEIYKPSPPFKNSVSHSHQHHLSEATHKKDTNFSMTIPPAFHFSANCRFQCNEFTLSYKDQS